MFGLSSLAGAPFASTSGNNYYVYVAEGQGWGYGTWGEVPWGGNYIGASDSTSSANLYENNVSEAASAADVVATAPSFSSTVSESASGVDATSSVVSFVSLVSETASGVDTVSSLGAVNSSTSEAASGVDTPSSNANFLVDVNEGVGYGWGTLTWGFGGWGVNGLPFLPIFFVYP